MGARFVWILAAAAAAVLGDRLTPVTMDRVRVEWEHPLMAAQKAEDNKEMEWWKTAVIYQIYPRSFKDSNGDGIGDLKGIIDRVGYLKDLGVDAVWLSPIYKTANRDYGYDIIDHKGVQDEYGDMETFRKLVAEFKKNGIKLIMDFVPNHTSDEHPWFKNATKDQRYRNYYVTTSGSVPNWRSIVDGRSAWSPLNEAAGSSYYHVFSSYQPDLNYNNPDVVREMKDVLKFWLDEGVDGFRMDAVPYLVENTENFKDESENPDCNLANRYYCLNHTETRDLDKTYEIVQEFRSVLDNHKDSTNSTVPKFLVLEATSDVDKVMKYYEKNNNTMPFNFNLMGLGPQSTAEDFKKAINDWIDNLPSGAWSNWFTGNHDSERVASRFDPNLVDAMNMLVMTLPGTPFTYYGEEIGMANVPMKDVGDKRLEARTPFQWDDTVNAGFTNGTETWLPVHTDYWAVNSKVETGKSSHLSVYKSLVKLHKEMVKTVNFTFIEYADYTFGFYRRSDKDFYLTLINLNNEQVVVHLNTTLPKDFPNELYVRVGSINSGYEANDAKITLDSEISLRPMAGLVLSNVVGPSSGVIRALPDNFLYSIILALALVRLFRAQN